MSSFGLFHHTARMSRRDFTGIIGKEMLWSPFPRPFISCHAEIVIISAAGCVFGTGLIVNGMCVLCYAVYLQHTGCIITHYFRDCNIFRNIYNMFTFIETVRAFRFCTSLPCIGRHPDRSRRESRPLRCRRFSPTGSGTHFSVR